MDLTAMLREFAMQQGASLFGVASTDRFDGAPVGHHPLDWIPEAKSVISIAIQIPPHIHAFERLLTNSEWFKGELRKEVLQDHLFAETRIVINRKLEEIGLLLACKLEDMGYGTINFPVHYSDSQKQIQEKVPGRAGIFSHRHAAVRAGLGEFGLNNLLITPQYGSRVRLNSLVTEAALTASPLLEKKVCLGDSCRLCIEKCGPGALSEMADSAWNEVWLNPVSRTDSDMCRAKRKKMMCYSRCSRICPVNLKPSLHWKDLPAE